MFRRLKAAIFHSELIMVIAAIWADIWFQIDADIKFCRKMRLNRRRIEATEIRTFARGMVELACAQSMANGKQLTSACLITVSSS